MERNYGTLSGDFSKASFSHPNATVQIFVKLVWSMWLMLSRNCVTLKVGNVGQSDTKVGKPGGAED